MPEAHYLWLRWLLPLLLVFLALLSLEKSVPGVIFLYKGAAVWSAEGLFEITEAPRSLRVSVDNKELHPTLRARFSVCPLEIPLCEPGKFLRLELPQSGALSLSFPENGETIGMEFFRAPFHPLYLLFLALLLAAGFMALQDSINRILLSMVLFTSGPYLAVTMGRWRGMDVRGHIEHIERIARDGLFVNARACWECHQPPTYYALASSLLLWPKEILPSDAVLLQGLALLLHCLSVPFIVGALRPSARSHRHLILYSALICLWPAAIFQSVRLGNDSPLNLVAFAALFFLLRKQFLAACFFAGTSYFIKNSGIVLIAIAAAWTLWNFQKKEISRLTLAFCGLALLSGPAVNLGFEKLKDFDSRRFAQMAPPLKSKDTLKELLLLDPIAFVRDAYLNPWESSPNRDHTPNYFWKSSLTGEWSFHFPYAAPLTRILSLSLLLLLSLAFWQLVAGRGLQVFPFLAIASSLSAIATYRYAHHFANHADFRFVYPAVTMGIALLLLQTTGRLEKAAYWATAFFLSFSQVFFALLWIFESG